MIIGAAALKENDLLQENYKNIMKKLELYQRSNPGLINLIYEAAKSKQDQSSEAERGQRTNLPTEGLK